MGVKDCRLLHNFLNSQTLMSLATTDGFNLWSNCVDFLSDKNLNIYFISGNYTNHVGNIMKNHKISLGVLGYQHGNGDKHIFQASGFCGRLNGAGKASVLEKWNEKFADRIVTAEELERNDLSLFRIVLTKVKYTDSNLTEKVLDFDL